MPAEQLDIERRQEAVAAAEIKVAEAGREASAKLSEAERLRQVILAEKQAATTAKQHAEALQRGMLAFASGEIVGANERSGKQVLSFRDVETKEKVYPLVLPAFDAVWRFVVKAMDRIRDMLKSAAEDKEQAAKLRLQADQEATEKRQAADAAATKVFEDAQQAAGHLLTEATALNDAALLEKKKAKEATDAANMARLAAAAERSALQDERRDHVRAEEETLNSLRLQHYDIRRAKAEFSLAQTQIAAKMTSEAIQKAAEALVTPQEVQRAAERLITPDAILAAATAKVTSDDVLKAAQRSVTVELVEDVIAKRVSAAQAARMTQGRDLGR